MVFFAAASLSSTRTFCEKHPGILLVVIGVIGEIFSAWKRPQTAREAWEKFFGIVLIAGLVLEIREAVNEDKEVAELQLSTAEVQYTNSLIWQTNLMLRSNVAELELKAQDRTITPTQRGIFTNILKNAPKGPIMVGTRTQNRETSQYVDKLLSMLAESGYNITSDIIYQGNTLWLNGNDSICFVTEDFESAPQYFFPLINAFRAIGIGVTTTTNVPMERLGMGPRPKTNEILILVTEKP